VNNTRLLAAVVDDEEAVRILPQQPSISLAVDWEKPRNQTRRPDLEKELNTRQTINRTMD
jgi:hypothetical protein